VARASEPGRHERWKRKREEARHSANQGSGEDLVGCVLCTHGEQVAATLLTTISHRDSGMLWTK